MRVASPSVLGHSLSVISALGFRLLGRVFTFGVNLLSAKWLHPQAYGVAHVSLGLLEHASVTLLKEGFRRAALRTPEEPCHEGTPSFALRARSSQIADFGCYATLGIATALACLWCSFTRRWLPENEAYLAGVMCVVCVYVGIVLQAVAEKQFVRKVKDDPLVASHLETNALIGKTLAVPLTYAILQAALRCFDTAGKELSKAFSLLAFAAGHTVYGFVWCWACRRPAGIARHTREAQEGVSPGSAARWSSSPFAESLWFAWNDALVFPFCVLAIEKALLNEAERLALVLLFASAAWPSWALVSNLGSLVCRLIFSPLEEIAFARFSQEHGHAREGTASRARGGETPKNDAAAGLRKRRAQLAESLAAPRIDQPEMKPASPPLESLFDLLSLQGSIGLAAVALGRPLASALLILLYGERWVALGTHLILRT